MSIYCDPYPSQGEDEVGSVFVAQRIMKTARDVDGAGVWGDYLTSIWWEENDCLKSRIGVNNLRKAIGDLWRRMSKTAKARFLESQIMDAFSYQLTATRMMMTELNK
jgi:hypothetical protein